MSELQPSVITLDKGLNLQTAKIVAPPGSVLDTLNYEQVDFQGQKRIDGFARYDGSVLPAIDEFYEIVLTDSYEGAVGNLVSVGGELFGVVVAANAETINVAVINSNLIPTAGQEITTVAGGFISVPNAVVSATAGVEAATDYDEHYQRLLTYTAALRARVEELPGSIIGLHWFRDRLYAVADVTTASLSGTTPAIYPNDILTLDGSDAKVLDVYVRDNTRVLFLSAMNPAAWNVEGAAVTRDGDPMGTVANGYEPLTAEEEIASFFESRSEAQVLEEDGDGPYDFGWRFVDQGWIVNFDDGLSLYGSLPSLNQNIVGLGIQGPSSTAGENGLPLILNQKVTITDKETQVNGWKSSQSPTTYELEADNLIDVDDDTIYADAYISWNATTGEVVAETATLTEYPATNTVVIEL